MRIARPVDNRESLLKVSELAEYGSRLHEDFKYPGNAPFEDTYHDHQLFYNALLGQNVDTAIEHFLAKTVATEADQLGPVVEETYVEFLSLIHQLYLYVWVLKFKCCISCCTPFLSFFFRYAFFRYCF